MNLTPSMNWYVAYTFPNAEKSIHKTLEKMKITSFVPLYETTRDWKDRKKKLLLPLFPNYIFIYSSHKERYEALTVKGVVKYVSFSGKPAIIPNDQITSLQRMMYADVEVHDLHVYNPGSPVKITQGPFTGVEGTLERINGSMRLVVSIECLGRTVSVSIDKEMVTPLFRRSEYSLSAVI